MKGHVLALCGGVGGAKLAFGLARALAPQDLTIVVNTGDDFEHLGLAISPDIDTVLYTLSGLADRERGWGRIDETWNFMSALGSIGGETWFNLGDRDLAMHVERTRRLAEGETLSRITTDVAAALGVAHAVAPMSDEPVRTIVGTEKGELAFQHFFVRDRSAPAVRGLSYDGAASAAPSPVFAHTLRRADLAGVVICPSNPYLSIEPILALPGVRSALQTLQVPVVAVSPIIDGGAVKGPAAKMMSDLGAAPSVLVVAHHYEGLIDGLMIDDRDSDFVATLRERGLQVRCTDIIMKNDADRKRLAHTTIEFLGDCAKQ